MGENKKPYYLYDKLLDAMKKGDHKKVQEVKNKIKLKHKRLGLI